MRISYILELNHKHAVATSVLIVAILAVSPIPLIDIRSTDIKHMESTQVSWQEAITGCNLLGEAWSLPTIHQLVAIYYRRPDIDLVDKTDYWSRTTVAGFAFGLNTSLGVASFDRHSDTDHFLCIRKLS